MWFHDSGKHSREVDLDARLAEAAQRFVPDTIVDDSRRSGSSAERS
jgi:hypothetical protein